MVTAGYRPMCVFHTSRSKQTITIKNKQKPSRDSTTSIQDVTEDNVLNVLNFPTPPHYPFSSPSPFSVSTSSLFVGQSQKALASNQADVQLLF